MLPCVADGERFREDCNVMYTSDEVNISGEGSYLQIPSSWNVGQMAQVAATITFPAGSVNDVSLLLGRPMLIGSIGRLEVFFSP